MKRITALLLALLLCLSLAACGQETEPKTTTEAPTKTETTTETTTASTTTEAAKDWNVTPVQDDEGQFSNSYPPATINGITVNSESEIGISYTEDATGKKTVVANDGEWIYEIKFRKGHYRYEYEVLAPTGKIIETEKVQ